MKENINSLLDEIIFILRLKNQLILIREDLNKIKKIKLPLNEFVLLNSYNPLAIRLQDTFFFVNKVNDSFWKAAKECKPDLTFLELSDTTRKRLIDLRELQLTHTFGAKDYAIQQLEVLAKQIKTIEGIENDFTGR